MAVLLIGQVPVYFFRFSTLVGLMLAGSTLFGATLRGFVTNAGGEPLPFANVGIEESSQGCATNLEGFFQMELEPGSYVLVLRYVGFATLRQPFELSPQGDTLHLVMAEQTLNLQDVVVSGKEDPAMAIMRKAIAERERHRLEVDAFSVTAYIKGLQRIEQAPQKVLGFRLDAAGTLDSTRSGIVYLSESLSRLHVQRRRNGPNRTREDMLASKVSGDDQAFSFNEATPMELQVYDPRIEFLGLSERELVSPLADDAMFFYRFRLAGTFFDEGRLVNRIELIPRRSKDPVFRGFLDIVEDSWRVHGTDLLLTRDAGIEFVDSLSWKMRYVPVLLAPGKEAWMPASRAFRFQFGLFGIRGSGYFLAWYDDYDLRPRFDKGFFGPEQLHIERGANERDSSFWAVKRAAPLSSDEAADYRAKDSLAVLRESEAYLDSLDRIENRPEIMNLLVGYRRQNSFRKQSWWLNPPLNSITFNTVEGWVLGLGGGWRQDLPRNRRIGLFGQAHYGLGNYTPMADLALRWEFDAVHAGVFQAAGGRRMIDYHPGALGVFGNSFYSLFLERNFLKLYEERFAALRLGREVANGLRLTAEAQWTQREPWVNLTDLRPVIDLDERSYLSNDPQDPGNEDLPFPTHRASIVEVFVRYTIAQRYASEPDRRFYLPSRWPTLRLDYRGAFPVLGSGLRYDRLEGGLEQRVGLGLWGESQLMVLAGGFPFKDSLAFQDYRHFGGNRTVFLPTAIDRYRVLPFFDRSTTGPWVQWHAEHHFNGFFFNKLPLLRELRWQLVTGGHVLWTQDQAWYGELGIGIEHIFKVLRIEGAIGWGAGDTRWGILVGMGF